MTPEQRHEAVNTLVVACIDTMSAAPTDSVQPMTTIGLDSLIEGPAERREAVLGTLQIALTLMEREDIRAE